MPEDLWKIRKRKGMSVKQLSAKSGITADTIRAYEAGEQSIPSGDRRQLARALYVGEWDIAIQTTTPPPKPVRRPAPPKKEPPPAVQKKRPPKKPKQKKKPPKSPPARETQIDHMLTLAARFDIDRTDLEEEIGKPLEELTRAEARHWNKHFMDRIEEEKPPKRGIDRRRAYLPEGVDRFEMEYLDEVKEAGDLLTFTLFDGDQFEGTLVGYGPYSITIRQEDGSEITLNKLAIAYYRRTGGKG